MSVRDVGMTSSMVKIRILAREQQVETLAGVIVDLLERVGYEVVEWTRPYPGNNPEEVNKHKVFLTALAKEKEDEPED